MTRELTTDDYAHAALMKSSPSVIINCECGYCRIFETNTEFNQELLVGNLPYQGERKNPMRGFAEQTFSYTCPDCDQTGNWAYIASLPTTKVVVVEPHVSHTTHRPKDLKARDQTKSETSLPLDIFKCPECKADFGPDSRIEGPDAPEIGWEYYECPECNRTHAPGKVI